MRNATNEQLKAWGWKWALRYEGKLMAVTVSSFDAAKWEAENIGEVVTL